MKNKKTEPEDYYPPRFHEIITYLQNLRKKGILLEEEYPDLLHKYGNEIRDKKLISKCSDQTFAKKLCIMNEIPSEYFT